MDSVKCEYRAVIKFLQKERCSVTEIYDRLVGVYGKSAPSFATVTRWFNEFKRGRQSLEDDPRSGRPSDVVSPSVIAAVEKLIMDDRRIKVLEVAKIMQISYGSVETIIRDHLKMSKVSARWVPRNLTAEDRRRRVASSRALLDLYLSDEENFSQHVVTGDETWIHYWDPESKMESKQWKHACSPPPRKFRTQPSAGKIMATIFWDRKGILLIDYLPAKSTMNGKYYAKLLVELRHTIKQKRRGMLTRGVWLLHDNAPVHKSVIAQQAVRECGFTQLDHPPYSPDLAPSDYYLFRNLKSYLRGQRYQDDESLKTAVETWFEDQSQEFYFAGIASLQQKWRKCVELEGDYIEK